MKEKKVWYKSKQVLFNLLTAVVGLAEVATPLNLVSAPVLLVINAGGNLLLRIFFSDQKIAATKKAEEESATLTPIN